MPIPIITNFEVNSASPIDTRLVATNSNALNEIKFPYDGLTVYTKDANLNYTYVAIPQGQAGFPGRWQVSSNGIYGGSGSMIGDTEVNMGSVGSGLGSKSFELILSASSSSDRAQYVTSFIRNQTGSEYDQIEIRNQVRYIDNGILKNGPYISFNPLEIINTRRGLIAFGTPNRNFSNTVERMSIHPDSESNNGSIVFTPSNDANSTPIYISYTSSNGNFIGSNWDGVGRINNGTGSVIISFGGSNMNISNANSLTSEPVTQFRITDISSNNATNVQIRVDDFSTDAGQLIGAGRSYVMKSITDVIRTTEHLYTRTQHLGYKKLETYVDQGATKDYVSELIPANIFSRQGDKILYVSNEGNFFDIELPNVPDEIDFNTRITDIRCLRQRNTGGFRGTIVVDRNEFPDGTEITIRFTYKTSPISYTGDNRPSDTGGYWSFGIYKDQVGFTSRKIKSNYADEYNGTEIKILYSTAKVDLAQNGDVITFRKGGGYWHIMSINRLQTIQQILSSGTSLEWDYLNVQSYWQQTTLSRIRDQGDTYINKPLTSATLELEAPTNPRSPFRYTIEEPENANDISGASGMPIIGIARDRSGNVFIGGSFQLRNVPNSELNFEKTSDEFAYPGMGNIILFAKIIDLTYLPNNSFNYSWGYCEVNVTPNSRAGNPFSDNCITLPGRLVVDINGFVTVEFNMSSWKNVNGAFTYNIDVNVPQFSYQS